MKTIYGPVSSWRLGKSLGLDLICRRKKICPFNCIYCQLGKEGTTTVQRKKFVETAKIIAEFKLLQDKIDADIVTFSGAGEPTLAKNLGETARALKKITRLPLASFTNGALLSDKRVRKELCLLGKVLIKLDAPSQSVMEQLNRPHKSLRFDEILGAIKTFRQEYRGKLCLQMMFVKKIKNTPGKWRNWPEKYSPTKFR